MMLSLRRDMVSGRIDAAVFINLRVNDPRFLVLQQGMKLMAEWRRRNWAIVHVFHDSADAASPLHPDRRKLRSCRCMCVIRVTTLRQLETSL